LVRVNNGRMNCNARFNTGTNINRGNNKKYPKKNN
jgi:hypothetical protein